MKLRVIAIDGGMPNRALVLADDNGDVLPNQRALVLEQEVKGVTKVTVTFYAAGPNFTLDF